MAEAFHRHHQNHEQQQQKQWHSCKLIINSLGIRCPNSTNKGPYIINQMSHTWITSVFIKSFATVVVTILNFYLLASKTCTKLSSVSSVKDSLSLKITLLKREKCEVSPLQNPQTWIMPANVIHRTSVQKMVSNRGFLWTCWWTLEVPLNVLTDWTTISLSRKIPVHRNIEIKYLYQLNLIDNKNIVQWTDIQFKYTTTYTAQ